MVHAIFLDAKYDPEDAEDEFGLACSNHVYGCLADPDLITRNYPPHMLFTPGAREVYERYREGLDDLAYDKASETRNKDKDYDPQDHMVRFNPNSRIAPERGDVVNSAYNDRDRTTSNTTITVALLEDDFQKALEEVDDYVCKDTQNRYVTLVTTPEDKDFCEKLIASVEEPRFVTAMVVFGTVPYMEKRFDLYDVLDIGIESLSDLLRLHRNNVHRRRMDAYAALNRFMGKAAGADVPAAGTMRAKALEVLKKDAEDLLRWEDENKF